MGGLCKAVRVGARRFFDVVRGHGSKHKVQKDEDDSRNQEDDQKGRDHITQKTFSKVFLFKLFESLCQSLNLCQKKSKKRQMTYRNRFTLCVFHDEFGKNFLDLFGQKCIVLYTINFQLFDAEFLKFLCIEGELLDVVHYNSFVSEKNSR
nr:hypothetical protein MarQu_225 [Marseillevirus sp.]